MIKQLIAVAAVAAVALPAQAITVVQWDFENAIPDLANSTVSPSVAASLGLGTAVGVHASSATDWTTPSGNGSANALSSNTWAVGDYYQFSFSTVGYGDLKLSLDQIGSGTGPRDFTLAYSTDGSNFTNFGSYIVASSPSWSSSSTSTTSTYTFDLSDLAALDNQASVFVRLVNSSTVSTNNGTVATGGTGRIDNFTVDLTVSAVPEPGTYAMLLAGLASLGFVARRRRA